MYRSLSTVSPFSCLSPSPFVVKLHLSTHTIAPPPTKSHSTILPTKEYARRVVGSVLAGVVL